MVALFMNPGHQKIIKYYKRFPTRIGYRCFLRGSQHFGFYPQGRAEISEKEAQILMQDLVSEKLVLQEGEKILDAGCGRGVVATYLAHQKNVEIWGITIVPFEKRIAEKRARKLGVAPKVHFAVMDYAQTAFQDNFFDAIYTTESLSHALDISQVLREFFRILKPGGRFAFFEYKLAPLSRFNDREKKTLETIVNSAAGIGLRYFHNDDFKNSLFRNGFRNVVEEDISENVRPSFYRLYKVAVPFYKFAQFFRLRRLAINTLMAYEGYKMTDHNLLRYCIYKGTKPH